MSLGNRPVLIFGTCYFAYEEIARATLAGWYECLAAAENLDEIRLVMIDGASPISWDGMFPADRPTTFVKADTNELFSVEDPGPGRLLIVSFADNLGHCYHGFGGIPGYPTKDGAGRAICQGVRLAREWGVERFAHVEADALVFGKGVVTRRLDALRGDLSAPSWLGDFETNLILGRVDRLADFEEVYDWRSTPDGTEIESRFTERFAGRFEFLEIGGGRAPEYAPDVETILSGSTDAYWTTNSADGAAEVCATRWLAKPAARLRADDYRHPVLFSVEGHGDAVIRRPAVRALAELFDGRLTVITAPGQSDLLCGGLGLARVVEADVSIRHDRTAYLDYGLELEQLEEVGRDCDLFLSLNPTASWNLMARNRQLEIPETLGFHPLGGRIEHRVEAREDVHEAEACFDFVRVFSPAARLEDRETRLVLPADACDAAARIVDACGGALLVAVHVEVAGDKEPPIDVVRDGLEQFLDRESSAIALVLGLEPSQLERSRHADRVVPCNGLGLNTSAALAVRADLFLGADSSMLHVADSSGMPIVALFGPTSSRRFGPRSRGASVLQGGQDWAGLESVAIATALLQQARRVRVGAVASRLESPAEFATESE